jgi:hypothetical protein
LVPSQKGEKFGFVDSSGEFRIAPTFEEALPFSGGLAAIRTGEKWGFIDSAGHLVIRPKFEAAYYFREGIALAKSDSEDILIDTSGQTIVRGFKILDLVADGRVPASRREKAGYLDLRGRVAITFVYDMVDMFSGGLAAVEKENKWGYVDRVGQLVIPLKFDEAGRFGSGLAPVRLGKTTGFIDRSGRFSFKLAFKQAPGFLTGDDESGLFIADTDVSVFYTEDGKTGYVNTTGKVIWGPTAGAPDHPPLFGWSEEEKTKSCEGLPEATRSKIAGFPDR